MMSAQSSIWTILLSCASLLYCGNRAETRIDAPVAETGPETPAPALVAGHDTSIRTIHIFVALCDNRYQGIVPVPAAIGNGQDPDNNLYWGCGYGLRTYFKKSADWKLLQTTKPGAPVLERLVFKHRTQNCYLVADAWDGQHIRSCTEAFLNACAGLSGDTLRVGGKTIGTAGNARLMAYIGHDGLMDFSLDGEYKNTDGRRRDAIVLACYSKRFFKPHLQDANVNPLVWSTHLMCPEAYVVHDALAAYVNGESAEQVRTRAAQAYSKYQKCSLKAARNLLVTGW